MFSRLRRLYPLRCTSHGADHSPIHLGSSHQLRTESGTGSFSGLLHAQVDDGPCLGVGPVHLRTQSTAHRDIFPFSGRRAASLFLIPQDSSLHPHGHGPQLARRARISDAPTLPSPSKSYGHWSAALPWSMTVPFHLAFPVHVLTAARRFYTDLRACRRSRGRNWLSDPLVQVSDL